MFNRTKEAYAFVSPIESRATEHGVRVALRANLRPRPFWCCREPVQMAPLTPHQRLQPSLLERLRDDAPDQRSEPREQRVLSLRALRTSVLRDLAWLLNATNLSVTGELTHWPQVRSSVLNYGLPDLSGIALAGFDLTRFERIIRQAIWDFEPRLIRASVSVKASAIEQVQRDKVRFHIEADLWAQPYPERLYLQTEFELDRAGLTLSETPGRSGV